MSNRPKQIGTEWETRIKNYLRESAELRHARRALQEGRYDVGDLHVWPFVIQAKAVRKHNLAGWVTDARAQADQARFPWSVVYVKKHGRPIGEGYAVLTIAEHRELMAYVRALETDSSPEHTL